MSAICVYCASGPVEQRFLDLAADLGAALATAGHTVVSGGGNISMMGALAESARAAGGTTVGIIPRALMEREVADLGADELVVTETMRERKRLMDDRADGFITLPGGIGTLEELFETWTAGYLGMHDKPVVLLDPFEFYAPLLGWLSDLRGQG
ncbi:TIGR00730 family Rossman fold protein, partial [Streptomyces sp. SID10244]|nr:TIGR00730 family Rossman fold protein [Streptomyces sp. SID10244]